MSVVYIKRLSKVECSQILACTPLTKYSAITVDLVCVHSDDSDFWCKCDKLLSQVLVRMKKNFPFVCVQSCSYRYHVVYRITFVTSDPYTFSDILYDFRNFIDTSINFYFN